MNYFNEELARIGFKLIEPCEELKPFIKSFWLVNFKEFPLEIPLKILADGNSGFTINFASPFNIQIDKNTNVCKDKFIYFPPSKHTAFVSAKKDIHILGVRFNTAYAYKFFEKDISSFNTTHHILENSLDLPIDKLYNSLQESSSIEDKIKLLESFLLDKLKNSKVENSPWIFEFIQKIKENKGDVNLEELCEEFSLNFRHVQRRFKIEVGLSPKLYTRIIRIQDTKEALSSLDIDSLTTLSYEKGFFDQSHFINEFKSFMKETPKEYLNKKQTMAKKYSFKKYKP